MDYDKRGEWGAGPRHASPDRGCGRNISILYLKH
jgi:hypothetical protein